MSISLADLFHELLELESREERDAFLARVRRTRPALADELSALLATHLADPTFLETPLPEQDRIVVTEQLERMMTERQIGPWRLDGVLHHGGMGTVYRAHREGVDFEQTVALKVIRLGTENPEVVRRFELERQLLARLSHPGIASLLDGGTTDDGLPYLVMEFVPGVPIDEWCEENRPAVPQLIELFRAVCDAVDFAHRNLVIHRDIKPSNLLVTPDGTPKLLDFGIAKLTAVTDGADTVPLTQFRMLTPAYASPEQYRGGPVSTASDVYSLGVLLYRLMAGTPPYRIGSETTVREAERLICDTMPQPPSQVLSMPDRRRRALVGDLDLIVLKALRKEPERRYGSARELSDDLERFQQGRPVTARPDSLRYRAHRFISRNRTAVAVAALILLSIAGGLGTALWQGRIAQDQRDLARAEAATAATAVEFLKNVLWSGNPWEEAAPIQTVQDVLDYAEQQIDPLLEDDPDTRAYILAALGEISVGRGDFERADRLSDEAVRLLRQSEDGDDEGRNAGVILRTRALVLHEMGELDEALAFAREALAELASRDPVPAEQRAATMNQIGVVELDLGHTAEAETWFRRTLEYRRSEGIDSPMRISGDLNNLSVALMSQPGREVDAVTALDEAIPIAREAGLPDPQVATLVVNRANLLQTLEEWDASEEAFFEALSLMDRSLGPEHPSSLTARTSLASLYDARDQFDRSEQTVRPVLTTALETLGPNHPVTAYAQNILALSLCRRPGSATADEGLALATASLEARRAQVPEGHWILASGSALEGLCLVRVGRADEAAPRLRSALTVLEETRGPEHRLTTRARSWLARAES